MSFDLPPHLQTLNSIPTSSPPTGLDAEQEDAFWGYMHTDDLFRNFGFVPSPSEMDKKLDEDDLKAPNTATPAPTTTTSIETPITQTEPLANTIASTSATESSSQLQSQGQSQSNQATLESFLAAFANEPNPYLMSMNLPYTTPSTSAPTPATTGVNTHDIMRGPESESGDKPSGAKKLKSMGAGHVEIEEDKRRRNTEASARFRAKKKEREQAVENRAKDLEAQVAKLASEKASLENENRLLKAIVLNGSGGQADALQGALTAFGKRKRQE